MTEQYEKKRKRYWQFIACMFAFSVFYYLRYFKRIMTEYNTTLLPCLINMDSSRECLEPFGQGWIGYYR